MTLRAIALPVLLLLHAGSALGQQTPDLPTGPGRVTGQVLHTTTGEPVPDVEVVLYALTAEGVPGLRRARSDAGGRFVFEGISNSSGISYLLGARYSGIPFPGASVSFAEGATEAHADVLLTELTSVPSEIRTTAVEMRVLRDAQGLRVLEQIELVNLGATTYSVLGEQRTRELAAFSGSIPSSATGFQMPLGVIPDGIARSGERIDYYGPIHPGSHDLSWTFSLPSERDADGHERFLLEGTTPAGAPFALLVPEGMGPIVAPGLERDPEPQLADGRPHTRFTSDGGSFRVELSPPPAIIDPSALRLTAIQAILDVDDAAIAVRETATVEVSGEALLMGTEATPLVRLLVPASARDLRFGTEAAGARLIPHPEGGLAVVGTAGPGTFRVELRYQLPVDSLPIRFDRHYAQRVPHLSIFVADTGEWLPSSDRLHRRRPIRTADLSYMHLEAFEVEAHESVVLSLDRLPPRSRSSRAIGLAAAGALGLVAVLWLSVPLRAVRRFEEHEESISALAREREALIWSIQDLDHDFETGKISEQDHREMRSRLRAQAVELLRQERAAEALESEPSLAPDQAEATAEAPAETQCRSCGAPLAPAHNFCPQCGAAQDPAVPSEADGTS